MAKEVLVLTEEWDNDTYSNEWEWMHRSPKANEKRLALEKEGKTLRVSRMIQHEWHDYPIEAYQPTGKTTFWMYAS